MVMRLREKELLVSRIASGQAKCDCGMTATRFDEAGRPECQRCHDLNERAQIFHERTQAAVQELAWEANWV
jgi:hypothetical protein